MPRAASGLREHLKLARRTEERMDVYCGIDWAEDHHDIALVDRDGNLLARRRVSDDAAGLAGLLALLAGHGDSARGPDPGGDRDTPRAAGRVPARHRPPGLPRQPDVGGPLPGPAHCRGEEVRPRRLGRAGQRAAHRHARAPAAARRHRAGPGHHGPGPRPARRRSGTAPKRTTSSAPTCASTTPASWPPSPRPRAASPGPGPAPSWPPRPRPPRPPRSPRPGCVPCCVRRAAPGASTPRPPGCARHSR